MNKLSFNLLAFIVAALALSAVAKAQTVDSTGLESTTIEMTQEEVRFLQVINAFRKKLGLNELTIHAGLQAAAQKHSRWMAAQDAATGADALSHYGPTPTTKFSDRIQLEGYANYTMIGENVACGSESATGTFKQFALSPTHLRNMMNPRYRHIGIARAGTGSEICPYYWTNDFGSKAAPSTDLPEVPASDVARIAAAIDAVSGPNNDNGLSTAQILAGVMPVAPAERKIALSCVVPYSLGNGVLASAPDTQTTIEVLPKANQYVLKVSYQQFNSSVQFTSWTISGVALLKNPFYPVLTLFSAPATRVGGFIIQVDTATGRAQFDPYPGQGGMSGLISCTLR